MHTLDFEQARHLALRTGFGSTLGTTQELIGLGREQAVETILNTPRNQLVAQPVFHSFYQLRELRKSDKVENTIRANKALSQDRRKIKEWAIMQALRNPNTLEEKMYWFWHNHFTSSILSAGRSVNLLLDQSLTIRKQALGHFGSLLASMAYDPLMLLYLDGLSNRKGKPNENFARELLELFTLGEGHFTEKDVKNIARAFTGWRIDKSTQQPRLHSKLFDDGRKTVFGKKGLLNSDDILTRILQHPRTAEFIAEKMWREFINLNKPDTKTINYWADVFRSSHYNISDLMRAVLTDDVFWRKENRGRLIKSPMDLVIGTFRTLDLEDDNLPVTSLRNQLKRMGQDIYTPPNVKGWPGGTSWISDATLPVRHQFIRRIMRGNNNKVKAKKSPTMPDIMQTMDMQSMNTKKTTNLKSQSSSSLDLSPEQWEIWLLPIPATTNIKLTEPRQQLQAILLDPAYQLK